jgi:hypothetical protein
MALLDNVKNILSQYTSGSASAQDAGAHFEQVAQSADAGTLANGIAEAMRSDQTPPFDQMVAHLFSNASTDQKAAMLNAMLAAVPADKRAQLSALIPGAAAAAPISTSQATSLAPDVVASMARQAEQHSPSIIDQMSGFYAQHPTLVKTLGTAAMMVAMRKIAERRA